MKVKMRGTTAAKAEIHAAIAKHVASGDITAIEINDVPMVLDTMSTPHGTMKADPVDPRLDKHAAHPHGHVQTSYTYRLAAKP